MSTVATILSRSMRLLGQLNSGETPTTQEYADGLVALNAMIDSWQNDRLYVYAFRDETLSMVAAQSSYTIGSGGNLNTTRPISIEDAYIVSSNNSYYVRIISDSEYDAIPAKTVTSNWPEKINYRPSMSTGTLYVYPVPDTTPSVLHLRTRVPLTAFSATTDTISLPPGWEEALATNVAVAWAPEFQMVPNPEVVQAAKNAKFAIQRANARPFNGYTELPWIAGNAHRANILTDQP